MKGEYMSNQKAEVEEGLKTISEEIKDINNTIADGILSEEELQNKFKTEDTPLIFVKGDGTERRM